MSTLANATVTQFSRSLRRLKAYLVLFAFCVCLPLSAIIFYGYQQLENELFYQYRETSANIVEQVNYSLKARLQVEQQRPINDYQFYREINDPITGKKRQALSPLSELNNKLTDNGLFGYFQLYSNGRVTSPILPIRRDVLAEQAELNSVKVSQRITKLNSIISVITASALIDKGNISPQLFLTKQPISEFFLDDSLKQYLIFYRVVQRERGNYIQGFIVNKQAFLFELIKTKFSLAIFESRVELSLVQTTNLPTDDLILHYFPQEQGTAKVERSNKPSSTLNTIALYQGNLIAPLIGSTLTFSTNTLPFGPVSTFIALFLVILAIVITLGCFGFYWLGKKQIQLSEQRMNFVSSVSHELKTPLTSILMYAEMLKNRMIINKQTLHEYHEFIFEESDRLARLINNVLQISTLNQQQSVVELNEMNAQQIIDLIQSKVSTLVDKHHFQLQFDNQINAKSPIYALVDQDALSQIIINLTDNAIKFFNAANIFDDARKKIIFSFSTDNNHQFFIEVRDFGSGITEHQQNKIFELFYRGENELTRTTSGTGIGLALVHQLMLAQQGSVSIKRQSIGVSFILQFKGKIQIN